MQVWTCIWVGRTTSRFIFLRSKTLNRAKGLKSDGNLIRPILYFNLFRICTVEKKQNSINIKVTCAIQLQDHDFYRFINMGSALTPHPIPNVLTGFQLMDLAQWTQIQAAGSMSYPEWACTLLNCKCTWSWA